MLAEEEERAGFPPRWIPVLVPLAAATFFAMIVFLSYAVLWTRAP
jgi:hypothetical protein